MSLQEPADEKLALLVVGMHRSGTSAISGVLNHLGFVTPGEHLAPTPDNPKGYFENSRIWLFHEHVFEQIGSSWNDPLPIPDEWFGSESGQALTEELTRIIDHQLSSESAFSVKDPRICRLLPMWIDALERCNRRTVAVLALRHPLEVAGSLERRNGFPRDFSLLLWLEHSLSAERFTRHLPRSLVSYDDLLKDWRRTARRIASELQVDLPRGIEDVEQVVDDFLSGELRHQTMLRNSDDPNPLLQASLRVWEALKQLTADPASAGALFELDAAREAQHQALGLLAPLITWQRRILFHPTTDPDGRAALIREHEAELATQLQRAFRAQKVSAHLTQTISQLHRAKKVEVERLETLRLDLEQIDSIRRDLQTRLHALESSTIWKLTYPLRRGLTKAHRMRRAGRWVAHTGWWTLTGQLRSRRHAADLRLPAGFAPSSVPSAAGREATQAAGQTATPEAEWYERYQRGANVTGITARGTALFSIVMPVHKVAPAWLAQAIDSVMAQTYPHWELICIEDGSEDPQLVEAIEAAGRRDPRVQGILLAKNEGVSRVTNRGLQAATGEYVLFMDHDDVLEPHAVARLADAAFSERSDVLYADEIVTGEDPLEILGVQSRSVFSHTYYLSHPYLVHPIAVRTELARRVGGLDPELKISQDIDFLLRVLEVAESVTHVPDVLYRWRTSSKSVGHLRKSEVMRTTAALKTAHLQRIGFPEAAVRNGLSFNTFAVDYFSKARGRVLAVIPTKNQGSLLRLSIETVRRTTVGLELDLAVVDHESDEAGTKDYLRSLQASGSAKVLPYAGPFNFSAINNHAISVQGAGYDYFLFLNNDIEATSAGWLDGMLRLCMRADVGVVGATLLYPDGSVQHAGVVVGMHGVAEHAFKFVPFGPDYADYACSLHSTREFSAVTAACMLVSAEAFHAVGGFDETLRVGFNDTDLCLRIVRQGYRVLNSAESVLTHHESASRGKSAAGHDPHPDDTKLFMKRHADFLAKGDPHFPPLLSKHNPAFKLDPDARRTEFVPYRTVRDFLPRPPNPGRPSQD